ncbi:MAG: helix-turn-helix transcriptional regulator [Clostridia bacterium]|nr:helix-turn-helix transcriptional regulator [Clostridia bacterium]
MTIGERIKQLRKQKGLTQEMLANYLCVSCQAVSKWEREICYPDIFLLSDISDLIGISIDELMGKECSFCVHKSSACQEK